MVDIVSEADALWQLMSFSGSHDDSFISPLRGHTSTFLVDDRNTNLALARSLFSIMARTGHLITVLDVDALYSSNSEYILSQLPAEGVRSTELLIPEPDSDLAEDIAAFLCSDPDRVLIIDSLNSVYHLLAYAGRGSRNRNLGFVMAMLSYTARIERRTILLTMYRRERPTRFGHVKSISDLSDLTVSVRMKGDSLALRCDRGNAWPGRGFSILIP
jgi:hypothetical protein